MIKYLLIIFNSFAIFLYSLFSGDGSVTISNTIPKTISPGKEIPFEITISKASLSGFAKFQLDLPEGVSVKEIESKGANFTYSDGIAKWIWSSLPSESDIIIKANLFAASEATGIKTIGGKFSYVENNNKQVVEMPPVETTIGTENSAANTSIANTQTIATQTHTENNIAAGTQNTVNSNAEPTATINAKRTIVKNSDSEYTVNISINKGTTKGFARYSDDLPEGISAKAISTDGSSFSVADGKLKFVWVTVPEKETLEISYSVSAKTELQLNLNGEYSFLEQNLSKKHLLQPDKISLTASNLTANNTQTTSSQTKTEITETKTTTAENNAANTNTTTQTITKTEGSVKYMVQIGAFTNNSVTSNTLSKKFNITETINSEMQGGFFKFMIGNYQEYKMARDKRENTKNNNKVKSAFVVAYNGAKRVTVQEALMISNQKWFK